MFVTTPDGNTHEIKVGMYVRFKCDVEQCAKVIAIKGDWLTVEAPEDGFAGQYIGRDDTAQIHVSDLF